MLATMVSAGFCDPVDPATARQVAQSVLRRHVELYGHWNGSPTPLITAEQPVQYQACTVAYNFSVKPGGHILVAVDDVFSPVLLYSTRSLFDPGRADQTGSLESLMVPALYKDVSVLKNNRQGPRAAAAARSDDAAGKRIRNAWTHLKRSSDTTARMPVLSRSGDNAPAQKGAAAAAVVVGPLLKTAWGQGDPYYLSTPGVDGAGGCAHALTGCVATAWGQVLRYWSWPPQGQGGYTYPWNGQVLSADFNAAYDWSNMPDVLDAGSSQAQKEAVSLLMYHLGVSAEMNYGCASSISEAWADEVLPLYFRYRSSMRRYARADKNGTGSPYTSSEWLAFFTSELEADPPRPIIFSIFSAQGGHEVVVDGYQRTAVDLVHINFGWSGYADGFFNITASFRTGTDSLWTADQQHIVIGIEPDNTPSPAGSSGGGGCFISGLALEWGRSGGDLSSVPALSVKEHQGPVGDIEAHFGP